MEIFTDGSITPVDAFNKAVEILVKQFSALSEGVNKTTQTQKEKIEAEDKPQEYEAIFDDKKEDVSEEVGNEKEAGNIKIEELKGLSTRTLNALKDNKISKVKKIISLSADDLLQLEGMGEKGVKEIKKAIGSLGLILKN